MNKECNCIEARYGKSHACTCPRYGNPVSWKEKIDADTRAVQSNPRFLGS